MSYAVSTHVVVMPQVKSALATLAELHERGRTDQSSVVPTGFDPLDEVLVGGIRRGEVVLVGGKPGAGKTILALQWARVMARRGVVAVYVCYEHDAVTLLTRLLSCELGEMLSADRARPRVGEELQARLRDVAAGVITMTDALMSDPLLAEAQRRVAVYADRLIFVTGARSRTGVAAIAEITARYAGQPIALFVDYLQKVPVYPAGPSESERVGRAIEGLKELALEQELVVVAVAAADQEGLDARRLHLRHLRGSTALAYEADVIIVLNEKVAVVPGVDGSSPPPRTRMLNRHVVFSVEKNRNGTQDVNLEFEKDFTYYRFHPHGRVVADRLWTEGSVEP